MELILEKDIEKNSLEIQQKNFLNSTIGKVVNIGLDVGLRYVLPDLIENEVIGVKNVILENGFKSRIRHSYFICYRFRKKCYGNFYW